MKFSLKLPTDLAKNVKYGVFKLGLVKGIISAGYRFQHYTSAFVPPQYI